MVRQGQKFFRPGQSTERESSSSWIRIIYSLRNLSSIKLLILPLGSNDKSLKQRNRIMVSSSLTSLTMQSGIYCLASRQAPFAFLVSISQITIKMISVQISMITRHSRENTNQEFRNRIYLSSVPGKLKYEVEDCSHRFSYI